MRNVAGHRAGAAAGRDRPARADPIRGAVEERDRDRRAVRPHRGDPDRGHRPVPGLARLHRPRELQGRRRGAQDQGPRDRPRVQGAAGVESYERHKKEGAVSIAVYGTPHIYALAAKLTEDRIPGTSPGLRQRGRRRRPALSVHLPHRRDLLVAGHRRGGLRQEAAGREPEGQEDRVPLLRQPRRPRADRGARGPGASGRASSSSPSRCRLPASRWAPRSSTSPSASGPTS